MTNPSAFPHVGCNTNGGINVVEPGMSLRDYFAGQAMASMNWIDRETSHMADAASCYAFADAMIHERSNHSNHCSDCGRNLSETGGGHCQTCEVAR